MTKYHRTKQCVDNTRLALLEAELVCAKLRLKLETSQRKLSAMVLAGWNESRSCIGKRSAVVGQIIRLSRKSSPFEKLTKNIKK